MTFTPPSLCDYLSAHSSMSDDEDDYLSDKFLLAAAQPSTSTAPKTYSQLRQERERLARLKNEQNRKKSRKQLEEESREAGLSKSLFERAQEEGDSGTGNKALAMMKKMGFTPGQSLGQTDAHKTQPLASQQDPVPSVEASRSVGQTPDDEGPSSIPSGQTISRSGHLTAPLPLNEWTGE